MEYFALLKIILPCLLVPILYKFLFVPITKMRFYKKQGLKTEFFPLMGSLITNILVSFMRKGDALYDLKHLSEKDPDVKAIVRNFGNTPVVMIADPKLKKEFTFQHENYEMLNFFEGFGYVFVKGLLGVRGAQWKKQRKTISQSFHFEFLRENVSLIVKNTRQKINEIAQKDLKRVNIIDEMETIAAENVGLVFFGQNMNRYLINGKSVGAHLMHIIEELGKIFISPGFLIFGTKFVEKGIFKAHRDLQTNMRLLEDTCKKIIEERKNSKIETKDLSWYLLESQKNPLEEDRFSDEEVIANYVTFMTAGTNTVSHLISMTLYALTQNPDVLKKLRDEIQEIYEKDETVTIDTLNKMNWLSALLKESLRMYNPTGAGAGFRIASKDHQIGDIEIKKGTMVGGVLVYENFHPKYFENAFEFNPQRWIDKPTVSESYVYTPFWAGPRNCIGQHMALIEAKAVVCEFVRKFDFEMIKGYKLKLTNKKAYGPSDSLPMILTLRK